MHARRKTTNHCKTLNPVVLLATLWMLGMKVPDGRSAACSALIVIGATSACYGSMSFNTIGLICMLVAIFTHTARMVMTQNMIDMLGEQESPAIMTLCYFAPLGAVMVGVVALVLEGPKITAAELRHVGVSQLTFSAALAFLLNLSSFDLVSNLFLQRDLLTRSRFRGHLPLLSLCVLLSEM